MAVEAWIEPTGGQWRPAGPNDTWLDLGIVAVHAALLRKVGHTEIEMWSPPRQRNADGSPEPDPLRPGQWLWNVFGLDDVESRALDVDTLLVRDRPMDAAPGAHKMNIFCSGSAHLPDGRLFVVGGHIIPKSRAGGGPSDNAGHVHVYDPVQPAGWTLVPQPLDPIRWYPTVTGLPDGRMLITSGSRGVLEGNLNDHKATGYWNQINNDYAVFDPATWRMLDTGPVTLVDDARLAPGDQRLATYPAVFVLPRTPGDGTVIALVETNRAWLYTYEPGATGPLNRADALYPMHTLGSRSYPTYGSMVLLPLEPGGNRARILAVGGQHESNTDYRSLDPDQASTATAEILDLDMTRALTTQPGWRQTQPLRHARVLCDTTLLADGTVLVSGGSERGWGDQNSGPVYDAELFDPESETFSAAARAATDRRHHSTALLQPDGTVVKAGSTGGFGDLRDAHGYVWLDVHTDAERYFPPYLWRGPRPSVVGIEAEAGPTLRYGSAFTVVASGDSLDAGSRLTYRRGATGRLPARRGGQRWRAVGGKSRSGRATLRAP